MPHLVLADLRPTPEVSLPLPAPVLAMPAPDELPPVSPPITASDDARQVACAILEVLAGVRSITDTAVVLGVTQARYYQLEARALQGLVAACEPRAPGPLSGAGLAAELEQLRAERDRLKGEAARYQALARLAHGAFGAPLTTASPPPGGVSALPGATLRAERRQATAASTATKPAVVASRPRKKRTATVRALRLAARVQRTAAPTSRGGASTPTTAPGTPPRDQSGG
jgi:hypothetical protein